MDKVALEVKISLEGEYREAQRISEEIAAALEPPRFYREKAKEVKLSLDLLQLDPLVAKALDLIAYRENHLGHGLSHVRKVAIDAGALVLIEGEAVMEGEILRRQVTLAHLAGILHDIRRAEKQHALRGAEEVARIIIDFDLNAMERESVVKAIGNHEAFRPHQPLANPRAQLISDALYDADKFRWGPDNFTETVWMMVAPFKIPLATLIDHFLPSLRGIERIKDTFRTETGREYGPDFIDRGLELGMKLYEELKQRCGKG